MSCRYVRRSSSFSASSSAATPMRTMALALVGALTLGRLAAPRHADAANVGVEICDNCYDDDGNGLTDRDDPMCTPTANGNFSGLSDKSEAKGAVKCQKGIEKASAGFVAKKLKRLEKCVALAFACVQLKNGDQTCLDKAKAGCDKQTLGIAADEMKLQATLEKACDDSQGGGVSFNDAIGLTGLGFSAEDPLCSGTFASFSDIADCIVTRHECGAERVLVAVAPRASEMLTALGHDPSTEFPCLAIADAANGVDGGGAGLGDAGRAKILVKCNAALTKAGVKLATVGFKTIQQCADAAATCIQLKPGAPCQSKAQGKCQKSFLNFSSAKGPLVKLLTTAFAKCESATLNEIDQASGLGFAAAATRCAQFNLLSADPLSRTVECVGLQELCEASHLLTCEAPRLHEYADFLNIQIPTGS